jgi:transcriptional regulator with XRE-family HTH domain
MSKNNLMNSNVTPITSSLKGKKQTDKKAYDLGNLALYMRTMYGASQADIASAVGITANDVCRIEHSNSKVGLNKVKGLADLYKVTVDALVCNDFAAAIAGFASPIVAKRSSVELIRKKRTVTDEIGVKGEDWVTEQERNKLKGTIYENAVNPNFANDLNSHFDIMSFDRYTGEQIIIEVKTTSKKSQENFRISAEELELLKRCLEQGIRYELHRVHHINSPTRRGQDIYTAKEVLEMFDFTGGIYVASIKKEHENDVRS